MVDDIVFKPSNQLTKIKQTEIKYKQQTETPESENDTDDDTYWADVDELQCLDVVNQVGALATLTS